MRTLENNNKLINDSINSLSISITMIIKPSSMNKLDQRKFQIFQKREKLNFLLWSIIATSILASFNSYHRTIRTLNATTNELDFIIPKSYEDDSKIPRKLWFTYKDDLLKTKEPTHYYENVMKTINAYRKAWGDPNAEANVLSDDDCSKILDQINKDLNKIFKEETEGAYKGDICRLGVLYLYGGYYFDVDMQTVTPYVAPSDVSFSSSRTIDGFIFNSFIASTPKHQMLQLGIDETLDFYHQKFHRCRDSYNGRLLGPCLLKEAYRDYLRHYQKNEPNSEEMKLLQEFESIKSLNQCGLEVSDPSNGVRHFFSRIGKACHVRTKH